MTIKMFTTFAVAIPLSLTVFIGSGVIGERAGLSLVPTFSAGDCPTTGAGGGC